MHHDRISTQGWIWLIIPIAALIIVAAGSGLFIQDVYKASSIFVAGIALGADVVTLFIALPLLIISAIYTKRGSQRAKLICLGILGYVMYNYLLIAFMVSFNLFFLVYLALLGFSAFALLSGLLDTSFEKVKALFPDNAPVRFVSICFFAVVAIFYPVWLAEIIPAHVTGELPRMIKWAGTPTHAYYVLDLALLFPVLGLTGVWLWQKRAVGYTLAGIFLTFLAVETLTIVSGMLFSVHIGLPYPIFPEILIYIAGSICVLVVQIWYLKNMKVP